MKVTETAAEPTGADDPGGWTRIGLSRRYALASAPVFLALALGLGWWVDRAITRQVVQNSAVNIALYVQSFIGPSLQELADGGELSQGARDEIDALLTDTPLGKRILSVKVWEDGGRIAWYSRHELIGRTFPLTDSMIHAWQGTVTAEFESLDDEEDAAEAVLGIPLLEVYSPVRENGTERIIAVAEFYQDATTLASQLATTRMRTWFIVLGSAMVAYLLLFGIVRAGGRVIQVQREALHAQVNELSRLLARNQELGDRVRRATRRTTELNERFLRRVSAELHDGPAQYLSLALLRLDALEDGVAGRAAADDEAGKDLDDVRRNLREALEEIRQISRGLGLPELQELGVADTVTRVVRSHERRTVTRVEVLTGALDDTINVGVSVKLTVYRLIQEALMNGYRHAHGSSQRVTVGNSPEWLQVEVSDDGPGFDQEAALNDDRLGLSGLRERVESIGGRFELLTAPGRGTTIRAHLPLGINV